MPVWGNTSPTDRVRATLAQFWRGRDVGIVYGAIVIVASLWIGLHSDATVRKLVENVSTNLDNMRAIRSRCWRPARSWCRR